MAIRRAKGGDQIQRLLASNVERVKRNACLCLGAYQKGGKYRFYIII